MPKVSVLLTSFNHEAYICESIESVLCQTFADFELIILDDASTDDSWQLIKKYSDPRVKAFRNTINSDAKYKLNNAITDLASGEYIAIHHSDDVWDVDKLKKQVTFMDAHPDIGAVFTNALAIAEDSSIFIGNKSFYINIFDQPNRTRHEWLRFFFNHGNALCHPSVLIRKSCYENCGLYRYDMAQLPDLDMWLRLCLKYEIHVLSERLVRFRVRDNEANASASRPETRIRTMYEFYKLLPTYRQLARFEDLVKVFPEAEKYFRDEETDMDFVLAMAALEANSYSFTKLFAQNLLCEAISEPERAANIMRLYDFGYKDFIALTGANDVFSEEKVYQLYASRSWKFTRPLRAFARLFGQIG